MEKRDARRLGQQAQQEIRRQAIKMLKQGMKQVDVAAQLEVSRQHVGYWWKRYREGGMAALKEGRRGRPHGSGHKLTPEQESCIQKLITDKTPDQLKMKHALWTRDAVRELIRRRYGVDYALQSLSVLLKRWGFTPQKPLKRAYEQNRAQVKQWMEQTYPQIEAQARSENAEVYWGDETCVKPEAHNRRSYSPRGKTPVVRQPARRFHSSVISAINNRGKMHWMALKEALNAESFIAFLRQLIKHRKRKVFLIVDNLRVHHSKLVKAWLEENKHRIELFYLPSYSPELNPDEYLNNHLKRTVFDEGLPINKNQLDAMVQSAMLWINAVPDLVAAFFHHPKVKYAAQMSPFAIAV